MTRVLKPNDTAMRAVRPIWTVEAPAAAETAPVVDPEIVQLRAEREVLAQRLQARDEEIAKLQSEIERAFAEGEAVGRKLGLAEAEDGRTAALAKLETGIAKALDLFGRELSSLERLAPGLAQRGLNLILGDDARRSELVADIVRRQVEQLGAGAIVHIEVSDADFPEPAELAKALGRGGLELKASDELTSGECRIRLALGSVEVGVNQQWGRLSAILDELSEPRATTT